MFSQLKLVNIPLYLRLVNAKKTAIFETTRNNGFSNKRRLNFQVYIVETGRLCYVPGGKGEMIISEGEVLCLPSLWAVAWFS